MWSSIASAPFRSSGQQAFSASPFNNAMRRPNYYGSPLFSVLHSTVASPIARHVHSEYFIGFHFSGRSRCITPGKVVEFGAKDVGFIRPGTVHEDAPLTPRVEYLGIKLRASYFEEACQSLGAPALPNGRVFRIEGDNRFTTLFQALRTEVINQELGYEMAVQSLVIEIIIHLLRRLIPGAGIQGADVGQPEAEVRWQVREAMQYLQAHYDQEFDLDRTAAAVGISKFYLVRLFRSATGMTLNNYLQQLRIEKAKELLLDPSQSISTIALDLGFSDHSHFTRVFRRFTGLTPLAFRQSSR